MAARPGARPPGKPGAAAVPSGPSKFQKTAQKSTFLDDKRQRTHLAQVLGKTSKPDEEQPDDFPSDVDPQRIDGITPLGEVVTYDLWKGIEPQVQSREGHRSAELYRWVIDQFAVGHNPRYAPEVPDKFRAHIFVWDLTRAMNVEVPHFVGIKELNLAQTCDWIRLEGPMRGWRRIDPAGAIEAARRGEPTLVMPKEIRTKLVGVVRPGEVSPDGRPRISGACLKRGNGLLLPEALGVLSVEYFTHF